ncbi:MAG: hypothetical protein GF418_05805 [Chitinivibrionales bacterium]|nr:hypothetical protein [Chitinivibrionales bacterium]MBD3395125.1 hypothetical protein [Chitinivibrionales bacterium]
MTVTAAFVLLIALTAILSAVYYYRRRELRGRAALLGLLRAGALATLILAFFEPTLRLTRFSTERPRIAVLVDASQSMRLFEAESLLTRLVSVLTGATAGDSIPRPAVDYYCFGDSLRPCRSPDAIRFDDMRSTFPASFGDSRIERARSVLVFSDGCWSNVFSARSGIGRKDCYFLRMPGAASRPYIRMAARAQPAHVTVDSSARALVSMHGFKTTSGPVEVTCSRQGRPLARARAELDSGFFADTVLLHLPSSRTGSFLYTITAATATDSLRATTYVVQRVVRRSLSAAVLAARPSLDKRFLILGLDRRSRWKAIESGADGGHPDVVFVFDWNGETERALRNLRSGVTPVFVGCLPCDTASWSAPRHFEPFIDPLYSSDLTASFVRHLPPPAGMGHCDGLPGTRASPVLLARTEKSDSLPILFEDVILGRRALVLAVQGLWRWEFWPQSLGDMQQGTSFVDFFLERVADLARANMNRSFYLFPERTPVYETDSVTLSIVLPAQLQTRPLDTLRLRVIAQAGDTVADTALTDVFFGSRAITHSLPPLAPGAYRYECLVQSPAGAASHSDSLQVHESNAELMASEQNTVVLGQVAAPLSLDDVREVLIPQSIEAGPAPAASTRHHRLRIGQSWPLLACALLLFALEWALRKRWRLD